MAKKITEQILVHQYWTTFMQAIQKSLGNEYYYYKTGLIKPENFEKVMVKLNDYYRLLDTPKERFNRYKSGFSVSIIHVFRLPEKGYVFVIMTRANDDKTGLFFERENYADARDKKQRLSVFDCYEFVRVNKETYQYDGESVEGKNSVWTVSITKKERDRVLKRFEEGLLRRDYSIVKEVCYGVTHWIGFAKVRQEYVEMKKILEKRFIKFQQSQQPNKSESNEQQKSPDNSYKNYRLLSDIVDMPKTIKYVRLSKFKGAEHVDVTS